MMKLYLDENGFESICKNYRQFFFKEIFSAIVSEINTVLCFSKEQIDSNIYIDAFLKDNISYWPLTMRSFDSSIESDVLSRNLYDYHETISIHKNLDKTECFQKYGTLAGNQDDISEIFQKTFLTRQKKDFDKTFTIGDDFHKWSELIDFFCPLNDIIILDPFCLNLDEDRLRKNLLALLRALIYYQKNIINIIIYTLDEQINCSKNREDVCSRIISKYLKEHSKCQIVNTTIIAVGGYDKVLVRKLKEHDRIVVTNYLSIITGDSHTFINLNDSLSPSSRFLEIKSHIKNENQKYSKRIIDDIQKAIELSRVKTTVKIFGAKKSNYLHF